MSGLTEVIEKVFKLDAMFRQQTMPVVVAQAVREYMLSDEAIKRAEFSIAQFFMSAPCDMTMNDAQGPMMKAAIKAALGEPDA